MEKRQSQHRNVDKLTRYAIEIKQNGIVNLSQIFIIVDRMPDTARTVNAALRSGTEIIQMSIQFWAIELAQKLKTRLGYDSEILSIPEDQLSDYLERRLQPIPILDFLNTTNTLREPVIQEEAQPYLTDAVDDDEEFDK